MVRPVSHCHTDFWRLPWSGSSRRSRFSSSRLRSPATGITASNQVDSKVFHEALQEGLVAFSGSVGADREEPVLAHERSPGAAPERSSFTYCAFRALTASTVRFDSFRCMFSTGSVFQAS